MTDHGQEHPEEGAADSAVAELKEEVAQLKQAMHSHAIVDQAIGLLVGIGSITSAEAWDVLREVSMNTNTKLRDVAEALIDWGCHGPLPGDIREELARRLTHQRQNSQCADAEHPPS